MKRTDPDYVLLATAIFNEFRRRFRAETIRRHKNRLALAISRRLERFPRASA